MFRGLLLVLCLTCTAAAGGPQFAVLVFSKTAGFRHGSIPDGIAAIDGHRAESMASYVHLTRAGNERLATAIRETLLESGALEAARSGEGRASRGASDGVRRD